jgi:16S rRNA (cytosine1402-N4)-methyltransferase
MATRGGEFVTESGAELHTPVMLDRVLDLVGPSLTDGGLLVDATLGMGGHAEAVLERFPLARVVGFDRDLAALRVSGSRLSAYGDRFTGIHAVFDEFPNRLEDRNMDSPAAFLFDLGVSSLQIDSDSRGFAYARDTGLDMRMDQSNPFSARDVVNQYTVEELARVLRQYGEEPHSRRIATAICSARDVAPISSTVELAGIVERATPAARRRRGHPAKRVFQAIRIEVNDELTALQHAISDAIDSVRVGGRIVVLSYHSLEDRIVKRAFAAGISPELPPGLPIVPEEKQPWLVSLTRGAEKSSASEIEENSRSISARLRAVVKVKEHGSRRLGRA